MMPPAATWMGPEMTILSEAESDKGKHEVTFTSNIKKMMQKGLICERDGQT